MLPQDLLELGKSMLAGGISLTPLVFFVYLFAGGKAKVMATSYLFAVGGVLASLFSIATIVVAFTGGEFGKRFDAVMMMGLPTLVLWYVTKELWRQLNK